MMLLTKLQHRRAVIRRLLSALPALWLVQRDASSAASGATRRVLRVGGPGQQSLARALRSVQPGDTVEVHGDLNGDVGTIAQPGVTLRGIGRRRVLHAAGRSAEGKAIVVVRAQNVTVENLEFRGARVRHGNGAGIRFESGTLSVRRCSFFDNENGLLSANQLEMRLSIADCVFGAAPRHAGSLHHLLYVGAIGRFVLTGCRFSGGFRGHLVKSRARENLVSFNQLNDGALGEASYELEFPNGGHNVVVANVIAQSALTQNSAILSMGVDAHASQEDALVLAHNTLVNGAGPGARFVQLWTSRLPAQMRVQMSNNLFVGPGQLDLPSTYDGGGNRHIGPEMLRDAGNGDFRLAVGSPLLGTAVALDPSLTPPTAAGTRLSPGALQSTD